MNGYIYVVDEAGEEIKGSRQYLAHIETAAEYRQLVAALTAKIGQGCMVLDSDDDRRPGQPPNADAR